MVVVAVVVRLTSAILLVRNTFSPLPPRLLHQQHSSNPSRLSCFMDGYYILDIISSHHHHHLFLFLFIFFCCFPRFYLYHYNDNNPHGQPYNFTLHRPLYHLNNTNIHAGSTAGAGSGDFHQYRMQRRKENFRVAKLEGEAKKVCTSCLVLYLFCVSCWWCCYFIIVWFIYFLSF